MKEDTFPMDVLQVDFTEITKAHQYKYLLVFIDTLTRWIEATPTRTEKATEVVKFLLWTSTPNQF